MTRQPDGWGFFLYISKKRRVAGVADSSDLRFSLEKRGFVLYFRYSSMFQKGCVAANLRDAPPQDHPLLPRWTLP